MIAQHEWICAHDISAKSILNQLLVQLWAEVQEASSGRMNVSLHPNGSLGGPDDMVDQMVSGRIQVHPVSGMILTHNASRSFGRLTFCLPNVRSGLPGNGRQYWRCSAICFARQGHPLSAKRTASGSQPDILSRSPDPYRGRSQGFSYSNW